MMHRILEVQNIAHAFGKKNVLREISFSVEPGELCGIVGENGSGKTTLLKIIVGDLKADHGRVILREKMGYCPQQPSLFSKLTVAENFQYYARAYQVDKETQERRRDALLEQYHFRKHLKDRVENLSSGTRQKLNLAISLLHNPGLLVLDEPYNGFDWDTYTRFWANTEKLIKQGCAILVVAHLISERQRFDRILHIENGCLK